MMLGEGWTDLWQHCLGCSGPGLTKRGSSTSGLTTLLCSRALDTPTPQGLAESLPCPSWSAEQQLVTCTSCWHCTKPSVDGEPYSWPQDSFSPPVSCCPLAWWRGGLESFSTTRGAKCPPCDSIVCCLHNQASIRWPPPGSSTN